LSHVNLPPETVKILRFISTSYEEIESTEKLMLYQAVVSNAVMQVLQQFVVVGGKTGVLGKLSQFAETVEITSTGPEYCEWRRATMRLLERSELHSISRQAKEEFMLLVAREVEHVLFTLSSVSLTSSAQSALVGILDFAADLQRTLVLQKARYQMLFFRSPKFDDRTMECVDNDSSDDGDFYSDRRVLLCIFPGLEKFGDESGHHPEVSNVLLKARVCCIPR
jgi:hypothetical protein